MPAIVIAGTLLRAFLTLLVVACAMVCLLLDVTMYHTATSSTLRRGTERVIPNAETEANLTQYQWKVLSCTNFSARTSFNLTSIHESLLLPSLEFNPHYKNPCLDEPLEAYQSTPRVTLRVCLPYFYVPGQPKCGTTDIYKALDLHPNVTLPDIKEPWWWTSRRLGYRSSENKWLSLGQYMDTFQKQAAEIHRTETNGRRSLITGDFSTIYFTGNDRWPLYPGNAGLREPKFVGAHFIRALTPNAKIIVVLRHPVNRLYSHYFENAKTRHDFVVSAAGFHESAAQAVRLMRQCLGQRGVRECLHDACLNSLDTMKVRLRDSMYSVFVKDWLSVFPRDQVLIVKFEEYATERISVLTEILNFLDAGPIPDSMRTSLETLKVHHTRWTNHQVGPMLNETRQLLSEFLAPFNRQLVDILQDKRFLYDD